MSRADLEASLKKVKEDKPKEKKKDKNLKKEMMLNMTPPNPSYLGNKNSLSMDSHVRKALKEEQKEILINIVVRGKYDILHYMIDLGFFNFDISKVSPHPPCRRWISLALDHALTSHIIGRRQRRQQLVPLRR